MTTGPLSEVVQHLRRAVLLPDGAGLTDEQLLGDYLHRRDEAALAALVRRHGPMVWGVCRRVLRNYHDAEDAFQATFLVLVRRAASIASRELLANWLHGVAHRTARKARAAAARRQAREKQVVNPPEPAVPEPDLWRDLRPLLDQELSRLPDRYRGVLVLCALEGKTRKEAARQLGVPEGTVAGRLARARALLARRLARHGLAVSAGALAAALAPACVPAPVASATIEAASRLAAGPAAVAGMISVRAAALTEGVLDAMLLTRVKIATAVGFVLVLLCGAGLLASHAQEGKAPPAAPKQAGEDDWLKETLLALDEKMWDASTRGDAKAADKLLAGNYLSIWAIDGRTDRATALETMKHYRYSDRTVRDVEVVRVSPDAAVLTYVASYKVSVDNEEPRELQDRRVSSVWGKRQGRWVLVFSEAILPAGE
jgi:RNA polymerase sigma factor (sigma-70 family)